MNTATFESKALLEAPKDAATPASTVLVAVARKYGLSPVRQMKEMFALRYGPGKIALPEYFANGLYDPELSMAEKKEFVGRIGSYELNRRMSPNDLTYSRVFVGDKVMYTALLQQLGLPTTRTQAVASKLRNFGTIPALRNPADVRAFLLHDAVFPVFGKPCEGRGSVGSALLARVEDEQIVMGNGRRASLDAFCAEVFSDYPEGFIFQDALTQHEVMSQITGPAVGTLRVVTVRDGDRPRVLYTVWKVPSPDAMSDNFWQKGSMLARVDAAGKVGRCRIGTGLDGRYINAHPVSGHGFDGVQIPHWDAVQKVACEAHGLFPEFGVVGWDMAVTPDGPAIVECNDNPFHALWQLANGRGILNDDFLPAIDAASAISADMLAGKHAVFKQREQAKGRRG